MAETLQDIINKRLKQNPDAAALGAVPGQTEQIQQVMGAKTGKAPVQTSAPAASSLAEQQTVQQGQDQLGQIAQAGQIKAEQQQAQSAAQEQGFALDVQALNQKKDIFRQAAGRNMEQLAADHARSLESMDFAKQKSSAEQAGFLSRLANDKYIDALTTNATKARLDKDIDFRAKIQESAMNSEMVAMGNDYKFKALLDADERKFNEQLARMDISSAMKLLSSGLSQESQRQMYTGLGNMISTGTQAWAQHKPSPEPADTGVYAESSTGSSGNLGTGSVTDKY